jgi:uncharacterized protein YqjF (DUF2071 family)
MNDPRKFLTARWTNLIMANFPIDGEVLKPYVPAGTSLDDFDGTTYVSMVAFQFLDTKVFGIGIPLHRDFEEINLRFYVKREEATGLKRGVVFVREIVPKFAIALVARTVYEEPYISLPTRSKINLPEVRYEWKFKDRWCNLGGHMKGDPQIPAPNSLEEFITQHYWGYNKQSDGSTIEYRVEHPHWRVWSANNVSFECDIEGLYGSNFTTVLKRAPSSAFIAEGSEVTVYRGVALTPASP